MRYLIGLLLLCTVLACRTTPISIPEDMEPKELFQRAQEAVVEKNDYAKALLYYQAFLERYPDDLQRTVEAEYEIAFIYYKLNDTETAISRLEALLVKYESEGSGILPPWPRVLAEKILKKLTESAADPSIEEE